MLRAGFAIGLLLSVCGSTVAIIPPSTADSTTFPAGVRATSDMRSFIGGYCAMVTE